MVSTSQMKSIFGTSAQASLLSIPYICDNPLLQTMDCTLSQVHMLPTLFINPFAQSNIPSRR